MWSDILAAITPVWKVLVVGLLFGAGLPVLFAVGVKSLSMGTTTTEGGHTHRNPFGVAAAAVCFLIIGLAIVAGLLVLTGSKVFLAKFGLS